MKLLYTTLFLLLSVQCFSQKNFSAELLTGFGANSDLFIVKEKVEDYNVYSTQLNGSYKFKIYKHVYGETGLGMQWYFSFGEVGFSTFRATTLRVNFPVFIGYSFFDKLDIGSGVIISSNRDFKDINFRERRNLRMSIGLKISYLVKEGLSVLLKIKQNLTNVADFTLINQPDTDVMIGVAYKIF